MLTFTGNTIKGFAVGDAIDLSGAAFSSAANSPTLGAGNLLQFTENGTTYKVQFDASQTFLNAFELASDGTGTEIELGTLLPTIGYTGNTATFVQRQTSPATIDSGITATDPAGNDIASATVTISSGFQIGDTLAFNNGNATDTFGDGAVITASQTGDALTLSTTSGNATASDYQTALDSVTYDFSGDPTKGGTDPIRTAP